MLGIDVMKTMMDWNEDNQRDEIMEFLRKWALQGDIRLDPQTTPWCAAIWNGCERAAGNKGTGRVNARSGLDYGHIIPLAAIKYGDTCIFTRGTSSWQGHITYFEKWENGLLVCIGGNQSDKVCRSSYNPKFLLGIRRI